MSSAAAGATPARPALPTPKPDSLPLYLDYNATTPLREEVSAAMAPFIAPGVHSHWFGNPSSSHSFGRAAAAAVARARSQVASLINAESADEIVLLSGATESLNYALRGAALRQRSLGRGSHLISCVTEHPATLAILRSLEKAEGFEVTLLPVDAEGAVTPAQVVAALREDTVLVSLMLANNEVGTLHPIGDIVRAIRSSKGGERVWIHTDASQALGKIPVDLRALDVDLLTLAGHKLYAPKGVGALYIRHSSIGSAGGLVTLLHGAGHESGRRGGTESVLLDVGLGAACEVAQRDLVRCMGQMSSQRAGLLESIGTGIERLKSEYGMESSEEDPYDFLVHGAKDASRRLPNTLSIGFANVSANELLRRLEPLLAASAGAACHSDSDVSLSYVLAAMGVPKRYGMGTLRLSVGLYTSDDDVRRAGEWIATAVVQLWIERKEKMQREQSGTTQSNA